MERIKVKGTKNIKSIGYKNGTLEVEFYSGSIFQYLDVPEDIYSNLINSTNIDKYFNSKIRGEYEDKPIKY